MSESYVNRNGDALAVYISRGGLPKATRLAIGVLGLGESLELTESPDPRWFVFRVIPPTILTLAEVRSGTGFPRGTRFVQLPDPKVGKAS